MLTDFYPSAHRWLGFLHPSPGCVFCFLALSCRFKALKLLHTFLMGAHCMIHEIRVWLECTLSAQLITAVLWICQHAFTENATITCLSHMVTWVCIFLLGWVWKANYQVISQRSSYEPLKYKQGLNSKTTAHLKWKLNWSFLRGISSLCRISPSSSHS